MKVLDALKNLWFEASEDCGEEGLVRLSRETDLAHAKTEPPPALRSPYDEALLTLGEVASIRTRELETTSSVVRSLTSNGYKEPALSRFVGFNSQVFRLRQDLECAKIRAATKLGVGTLTIEVFVVLLLRRALTESMFLHVLRLDRQGRCPRPRDLLLGSELLPTTNDA